MRMTVALLLTAIFLISCTKKKALIVHNCSKFWEGTFNNEHKGEVDLRITRKGNYQIEVGKGGSAAKFKVDWLDSCRYRLTYVSSDKPVKDYKPVIVQIIEVKESSYVIEGWLEGQSMATYRSELFKVE